MAKTVIKTRAIMPPSFCVAPAPDPADQKPGPVESFDI